MPHDEHDVTNFLGMMQCMSGTFYGLGDAALYYCTGSYPLALYTVRKTGDSRRI